ncbi:ATP-binding protein [Ideonella margarita]|uniref:histidine kinase n=1 Tax=Ideonella margarita TaxID=2984191 RepID=A0ABU9C9K2_9BURK
MSWPRRPWRLMLRPLLLAAAALSLVLAAGWAGFGASERQGTDALRAESNHQLDLFASAVEGMIKRLEHVPATVQLNQDVVALLRQPGQAERVAAASLYLRRLNAHLGSLSVFVMNERGTVLAASDASMVGEDLAYRPFFLEALSGRVGRHFAIGTQDSQPGYYVSHPIHDGARVAGVATIKISLEPINQAWAMLGAPALLADSNQVVILSSQPEWRYTTLADLPLERRVDLQLTRMYNQQRLGRFPLQVDLRIDEDSQIVEGVLPNGLNANSARPRPASRGMLVLGRTLNGMDWRLMMFTDLQRVRQQAVLHSLLAAVTTGFLLLLALFVNQRRRILSQKLQAKRWLEQANTELENKVTRRTGALSEANNRLRKEVAEREQAELTLRRAQDELVHAGKMAALGQLATGITHELTQPLGAIRTLSGNALEFMRRGDMNAVQGNLNILTRLADQMGGIIQPLKGFARKSAAQPASTDTAVAMGNALFLYDQRLRKGGVQVHNHLQPGQTLAWCDPNRLEQVLINLIGNAADAMAALPEGHPRELHLNAGPDLPEPGDETADETAAPRVVITVRDTGPGLATDVLERLFEPFFSTKEAGVGLGLGLAISRDIAREAGGELDARNAPEGGACFVLRLPAAPRSQDPQEHTPS